MPSKKLPLRPNVCMLVYNSKGQLFLGERKSTRGHWQFPQGGAEPEFSLRENVKREIQEELGLEQSSVGKLLKLRSTHEYDWHKPPPYAKGRWRGQAQTFWLVEFVGRNSDITLDAHDEPEFSAWRWCAPRTVRRLAAPHRLAGYEGALQEFEAFWRKREGARGTVKRKRAKKPGGRPNRDSGNGRRV